MKINTFHNYIALYGCTIQWSLVLSCTSRSHLNLELVIMWLCISEELNRDGKTCSRFGSPIQWILETIFIMCHIYGKSVCQSVLFHTNQCSLYINWCWGGKEICNGDYIKISMVYTLRIDHLKVHIDNLKFHIPQLVEDTFVGLITDIELATREAIFISTKIVHFLSSLKDLVSIWAEWHMLLAIALNITVLHNVKSNLNKYLQSQL